MIPVVVDNRTPKPVATSPPWPCLLMYRWIARGAGEVVVEHGFRSIIQPPAQPGSETEYTMRIIAPKIEGQYVLRVTMIQEGWRWLDHLEPKVTADAVIRVVGETVAVPLVPGLTPASRPPR